MPSRLARFKIDENLPSDVGAILRAAGFDAVHVLEQGMGGKSDPHVADVCRSERRTILTLDLGFADIRSYPPGEYPGIVVLRLHRQDRDRVMQSVRRLVPLLARETTDGHLWIVEEEEVRIRGPADLPGRRAVLPGD